MRIEIINGPNLGRIGQRETSIYGHQNFESWLSALREQYPQHEIGYSQSNCEGTIIDLLYEAAESCQGILLNAGAYTHSSIAILDAIRAIDIPVVEVHISQVFAREAYRRHSMIAEACQGVIAGFGLDSYRLGIEALLHRD